MEIKTSGEIETKINDQARYISWLEKMMFLISHPLRQSVTNVLGLSNLLNGISNSKPQFDQILKHLRQSALSLDKQTRDMTVLVNEKILMLKKNDLPISIKKKKF